MSPVLWFFFGLAVLTVLLHVGAWSLFGRKVRRILGGYPWLPRTWHPPVLGGEAVEFSAADGVILRGTYFAAGAGQRAGVVVFCHELNGNQWEVTPYLPMLLGEGYDVLTFDFRNHGNSGRVPGYDPIPWATRFEVADVRAAVDWVAGRNVQSGPPPVAVMGVSRGAAVALAAAAEDERVRAAVLDGLLGDESFLVRWVKRIIGWRRRCRFLSPQRHMDKVRQPLLLIHGARDRHVQTAAIEVLEADAAGEAELWVVPRARHGEAIDVAREEYRQRVGRFFRRHLASGHDSLRVLHPRSTPTSFAHSHLAAASARR